MEENKFEKQVQQKMDELQIQPSDAVWKKIELQIEKRKSHRWGLIILFLSVGILLTGGYWLWNADRQSTLENANSVKNILKKNSDSSQIRESKIVQHQGKPIAEPKIMETNNAVKDEEIEKGKTKQHNLINSSNAIHLFISGEKNTVAFTSKKNIKSGTDAKTETAIASAEAFQNKAGNGNIINDSLNEDDKKINVDTISNPIVLDEITKQKDTSKRQQTIPETVKHSTKNKWKFGLLFVGGISGAGKDFLALSAPAVSYNPGTLNSGGPQQQGFSSSATKAGFGFIAGVSAEKNISKKVKFASGINFKSFSTSIKLYDSVGTYYARTTSNRYVNHFNFIEAPLSLKFQLGKGKHLPILWQAGITISQLISSNALQLNSSTGYYYKENSFFNKTQIGFNTAFLFALFSKQKNSVLIGPYFYYDATQIANQGLYNKKHLAFTGIHTSIIFGK